MTNSSQPTPKDDHIFALEAFEYVHNDRVLDYEAMGSIIDDQVKVSESGMLVHALTKISEDASETTFRWLEIFENSDALEAHVSNPCVIQHIEKLSDDILSNRTKIVIYADWNNELKAYWHEKLSGALLVFADMKTGFFLSR